MTTEGREIGIIEAAENIRDTVTRPLGEALDWVTTGRLGKIVACSLIAASVLTLTEGGLLIVDNFINSSDGAQLTQEVSINQRYREQPNNKEIEAMAVIAVGALTLVAGAAAFNKNEHPND